MNVVAQLFFEFGCGFRGDRARHSEMMSPTVPI